MWNWLLTIDLIFLFITKSRQYIHQEGKIFTTPNWPNPYTENIDLKFEVIANSSQGVAVVFEQFLASPEDYVFTCPINSPGCQNLYGDAMDHGRFPKILKIAGSATIKLVSINKNSQLPHAGISGKAFAYDLQNPSFFNCGDRVDLIEGKTFYLISQNYPLSPLREYNNCSISFTSDKNIRLAVYDYYGTASDSFSVTNNFQSNNLTGFATEDEPVVFVFEKSAEVSFTLTEGSSFAHKRFYILVNHVDEYQKSENSCIGNGQHTIEKGKTHQFGTANFGIATYENNMECSFTFDRDELHGSIFGMAVYYETEKCCDKMSLLGLREEELLFQGFQEPAFWFSSSAQITMDFKSDQTMGATGFNGSIQVIDCLCKNLSWSQNRAELTSPGYEDSATYCPNLNCSTDILFDSAFDLVFDIESVELRQYDLTEDSDSLVLTDAYGHQIVKINPSFLGPTKFLVTAGPVNAVFQSNNMDYFPLENVAKGFKIPLLLIKKEIYEQSFIFNSTFFMKDISNLQLSPNITTTFQYRFKARANQKISIYFFTKTADRVSVDIFDGTDVQSKKIDNKALYSNIAENGYSFFLQSSGESLVIRIRVNPFHLADSIDFQAMVTDVEQEANCDSLVYSLTSNKPSERISVKGNGCMKVLHFTDSSYHNQGYQHLDFEGSSQMEIFMNLRFEDEYRIASSTSDPRPQHIFNKYVVLKNSSPTPTSVVYSWGINNNLMVQTIQNKETVMIMTADFLQENSTSFEQQFSVQLEGESNVQTGLKVVLGSESKNSNTFLRFYDYTKLLKEMTFDTQSAGSSFTHCGDKVVIEYKGQGGSLSGLKLLISQAGLSCQSSGSLFAGFPHSILLSILIFLVY